MKEKEREGERERKKWQTICVWGGSAVRLYIGTTTHSTQTAETKGAEDFINFHSPNWPESTTLLYSFYNSIIDVYISSSDRQTDGPWRYWREERLASNICCSSSTSSSGWVSLNATRYDWILRLGWLQMRTPRSGPRTFILIWKVNNKNLYFLIKKINYGSTSKYCS